MSEHNDDLPKYEFALTIEWDIPSEESKRRFGLDAGTFYFDSKEGREDVLAKYSAVSFHHKIPMRVIFFEGYGTRIRTIARACFSYGIREYLVEHDFGFGFPPDAAENILKEGALSCDCSRSKMIREKAAPEFPKMKCGHEIEIRSLEINYK